MNDAWKDAGRTYGYRAEPTPATDAATRAQAERTRAADAAVVARCLTIQAEAMIREYGPAALIQATADALELAAIDHTHRHDYPAAGQLHAVAGAMTDAARNLTALAARAR